MAPENACLVMNELLLLATAAAMYLAKNSCKSIGHFVSQ